MRNRGQFKLGGRSRRLQHRDVHVARHLTTRVWCCAGTGKTHTVRGILNVWHIVHYNRFLESLVKALARSASLPPAPWPCQHPLHLFNRLHSKPCILILSTHTVAVELSAFQTLRPELVNTHCSCPNVCICKRLLSNRYAASLTVQLLCYCLPGVWANEPTPVSQHLHPSVCESAAASKPVVAAPVKST